MTKQQRVIADMSMSLDGFIADENDGVDELFGWYGNGDVEVPTASEQWTFRVTEASAEHLRPAFSGAIGALICGRRIFDLTGGWGGKHPIGCPVFVVSHSVPDGWPRADSATTFYTDPMAALEAARAEAGERDVVIATPTLTQQYLDAGVLDAISVALIPVLLGRGIRFFDHLAKTPVRLGDPAVTQGKTVTHLTYAVKR
jgi:dihydrofolate reductase